MGTRTELEYTYEKNPDGTMKPPVEVQRVVQTFPVEMSKSQFIEWSIGCFKAANNSTQAQAEERFLDVIEAAKNHANKRVRLAHERYTAASSPKKNAVVYFLGVMLAATVVTQAEYDQHINNWPEA